MKFGKLSAVAAAAVVAVAGNVVAGGGYTAESVAASSDYMFWADAKTGYERLDMRKGKSGRSSFWAVRTKMGVESTAGSMEGLGFEMRLGGMFNTNKKKKSALQNVAEAGASVSWNLGSMLGDGMTLRPAVGYERRYGNKNGVLLNLDLGTQFAEEHYVGLRGGLNFLVGHNSKGSRRLGYEIAGLYNYKFSNMMGLGLEVGYRNYRFEKSSKKTSHHWQFLGGVSFSA